MLCVQPVSGKSQGKVNKFVRREDNTMEGLLLALLVLTLDKLYDEWRRDR
jgi:hypothetical protein